MRRLANDTGLSLLELVAVLGLTSVLLSLAVFGHAAARERISLAFAARQVAMDLQLTRVRAIARNREQRLQFAVGTARYQPQERSGAAYENVGVAKMLPAGIRIEDCTATGDAISFRSQGGAGSFGTVTIGSASHQTQSIAVSITGRTRLR